MQYTHGPIVVDAHDTMPWMGRRVLHVSESLLGGLGRFIASAAEDQLERGYSVGVAAPLEGSVHGMPAGSEMRDWPARAQPGPWVLREIVALSRIVDSFEPDVVHLHSSKAGLAGRLLLRGRLPTVHQPHAWSFFAKSGPVERATRAWEVFGARWTDLVLCVSEDERRLGQAAGVRTGFRVLPNGVDLDRSPAPEPDARARARAELGIADEPLAVCVGRLHRQKNQAALLDIWPQLREELPTAILALLGDGPDRPELEARDTAGVRFVGQTDRVRLWLEAANVVVQPSRWEGMSLSVLEALACARSVVVTDVPGMREVAEGVGAVVPEDEPDALRGAVAERLRERERADTEGAAGRARVEERHDLRGQLQGVRELYDELVVHREGERLRVLVVQPYAESGGGSESWLLRLLDATDALDVRVVLLKDGPMRLELEGRGIPVTLRDVGRQPWSFPAAIAWLAGLLRRERPDVVLGNVLKAQLVAAPAGRLARVPTVWAKHDHGYDSWLAVPLGRLSDRVVAAVEELGAPVRRSDVVIIPPPAPDEQPASREDARQAMSERGIPLTEDPTLIMAGRLVPFKGTDDAIRALAMPGGQAWRLVVAGVDDHSAPGETERLCALVHELGVEERVYFAGLVPRVSHWLAAFDALAVLTKPTGERRAPSKEGFGTSAFEAMVAGIPVIAAGGGAVVRRLEGRAGVTVSPGDPAALAQALGRLADPGARSRAGAAAREIVADHPDAAKCAELLVDVLRGAASR
jgi:glycosyltransferase involved in cell wall biosynthesis